MCKISGLFHEYNLGWILFDCLQGFMLHPSAFKRVCLSAHVRQLCASVCGQPRSNRLHSTQRAATPGREEALGLNIGV